MSEYKRRRQEHLDRADAYDDEADQLLVSSGWMAPLRALLFFVMLASGLSGWLVICAGTVGFAICGVSFAALVSVGHSCCIQ